MTASLPRPNRGNAVKGLAKSGNRLRHAQMDKSVDAGPFRNGGRLLPNDRSELYAVSVRFGYTLT